MIGRFLPAFLAVACVLLALVLLRTCNQVKDKEGLVSGLNKNLRIQELENGKKQTTINLLQADRKDLLRLNAGQDSALRKLQTVVKKDPNIVAATVFSAITEGKAAGPVDPVLSVVPETTDKSRPPLKLVGTVKAPGFEATVEAMADSIRILKYRIFSGYAVEQTTESQGLFRRPLQVVKITPDDPGSTVIDARSYSKPAPRQYTGLKILGGFVAGAAAVKYGNKILKTR